jgi:hypothetical protein
MLRKDFNPRIDDALIRLARQTAPIVEWIEAWADRQLAELGIEWEGDTARFVGMPISAWLGLRPHERMILFHRLFHRLGWPMGELSTAALKRLDNMIHDSNATAVELPGWIRVERRSETLVFRRTTSAPT